MHCVYIKPGFTEFVSAMDVHTVLDMFNHCMYTFETRQYYSSAVPGPGLDEREGYIWYI